MRYLESQGFTRSDTASNNDGSFSYRLGNINIITVSNKTLFNKWMQATEMCKVLRVQTRDERIAVFDSCIRGTRCSIEGVEAEWTVEGEGEVNDDF